MTGPTGHPVAAAQCSAGARVRADPLSATAPPARGFLLLEVPGAWGPELLAASGLHPDVARTLRDSATSAGLRLLLIRRPGRHPDLGGARRWGVVAIGGEARWGSWADEADLLRIDVAAEFGAAATAGAGDPRPLALICTQGRHDLCCATEGRPVVAVASSMPDVDVWECSHLGGDRFAANLLWLPSGHLFGGLDAVTAGPVLAAALDGRVMLEHFRGRCGDAPAAQAAQWHLMRHLGEDRPERIATVVVGTVPAEGVPFLVFARHAGHGYQIRLVWHWSTPQLLTCQAAKVSRVRLFTADDERGQRRV